MYVGICLLLICSLLGDEHMHNIDSINISAIVTDYTSNATINRYKKVIFKFDIIKMYIIYYNYTKQTSYCQAGG